MKNKWERKKTGYTHTHTHTHMHIYIYIYIYIYIVRDLEKVDKSKLLLYVPFIWWKCPDTEFQATA